jgi:hypothetical protein
MRVVAGADFAVEDLYAAMATVPAEATVPSGAEPAPPGAAEDRLEVMCSACFSVVAPHRAMVVPQLGAGAVVGVHRCSACIPAEVERAREGLAQTGSFGAVLLFEWMLGCGLTRAQLTTHTSGRGACASAEAALEAIANGQLRVPRL